MTDVHFTAITSMLDVQLFTVAKPFEPFDCDDTAQVDVMCQQGLPLNVVLSITHKWDNANSVSRQKVGPIYVHAQRRNRSRHLKRIDAELGNDHVAEFTHCLHQDIDVLGAVDADVTPEVEYSVRCRLFRVPFFDCCTRADLHRRYTIVGQWRKRTDIVIVGAPIEEMWKMAYKYVRSIKPSLTFLFFETKRARQCSQRHGQKVQRVDKFETRHCAGHDLEAPSDDLGSKRLSMDVVQYEVRVVAAEVVGDNDCTPAMNDCLVTK
ncbi:unnamed protein product [Sphagnum balticum]